MRRKLSLLALTVVLLLFVAAPEMAEAAKPYNDDWISWEYPRWWWDSWPDSNVDATKEPGEPNHGGNPGGHSVWYRNTAFRDGRIAVNTCGSGFDTLAGMYTGSDVASLTTLASNDDTDQCGPGSKGSVVSAFLTDRTDYYVAIDGKNGASGTFSYEYVLNDSFSRPFQIGEGRSDSGVGLATTIGATKEPGEPAHAGNGGGKSVWYAYRPGGGHWVQVGTCGADASRAGLDTLLAVYTGAGVAALTPVASNDDTPGCGSGGRQSRVTFFATGGTNYSIAVDGKNGASGRSSFQFDDTIPPPAVPVAGFVGRASRVALAARAVRAGKTAFRLPIRNRNSFAVTGSLTVETTKGFAATARKPGRRKRVKLGRARFRVESNGKGSVRVRLPRRARRLLARLRKLRSRVHLSVKDPRGVSRTARGTLILRAAKRKRPKRRR